METNATRTSALTTLLAVLASAAVLPGVAAAQAASGTRSISVSGHGEASGPPDKAGINAGVETRAATVAEAAERNRDVVERIMDALADRDIEKEDIQTTSYNVWPEQNRHDPRQSGQVEITGYRVSNIVNVTVRDLEDVGEVIAAVTNAGANSIHGIQFTVEDSAALEESARKAAMEDARSRAESLAALAGVELGEVLTISTSGGAGHPRPMMAREAFGLGDASVSAPGISPGQLSVTVQIHATFAIR